MNREKALPTFAVCAIATISLAMPLSGSAQTAAEKELADLKLEKERVELQKSIMESELALAKARFGTPPTGMTGEVGTLGEYTGFLSQRKLYVSARAAQQLGAALPAATSACSKTLLTGATSAGTRILRARSLSDNIVKLEQEVSGPGVAAYDGVALSVAQIGGLAGSIVSLVGLFQVNYDAKSASLTWPDNWVLFNVAAGIPVASRGNFLVDGAPRTAASTLADRLSNLKLNVDKKLEVAEAALKQQPKNEVLKERVAKAKALKTAVAEITAAVYKSDDKGVAPIAELDPYLRLLDPSNANGACVAQVVQTDGAASVFSKSTIFGKGGKVFGNIAANFAVVVTDQEGLPIAIQCASEVESSSVKVSDLIKKDGAFAPSWKESDASSAASACVPAAVTN